MNVMLHNRDGVHHPDENRGEYEPVIERRPVQVVTEPPCHQERDRDLNERFHSVSLASPHWCGKGPFRRPAQFVQTAPQGHLVYSGFPAPFSQCHRKTAVAVKRDLRAVVGLRFCRRPTAIPRSVRSVIVHSVKGFTQRTVAHIGPEVHKIIPSWVNGYPATTIPMVAGILGVATPIQHGPPQAVSASAGHAVRLLGREMQAPAGRGVARYQRVTARRNKAATVAHTLPSRPAARAAGMFAQNEKAPEFLAGQINGHEAHRTSTLFKEHMGNVANAK